MPDFLLYNKWNIWSTIFSYPFMQLQHFDNLLLRMVFDSMLTL